jgi:hypothetical protein
VLATETNYQKRNEYVMGFFQRKWRTQRSGILAELATIAFVGLVAAVANATGIGVILFPELAALSYDMLRRPNGKWAVQPFRLVITPTLTAVVGLFVSRHAHYGVVPVLAITLASLAIIRLLKSSIGPAISAGLLPLVLGERHWLYPIAIFIDLLCLALLLWLWKSFGPDVSNQPLSSRGVADKLHSASTDRLWVTHLIVLVTILAITSQYTGLRMVLFPPIVVMAYEIFGHPELPRWAERSLLFPIACVLSAGMGIFTLRVIGEHAWSVIAVLAVSIVLLRLFRIHMPPALAVGLIPFIMPSPNYWYPAAVAIGAGTLTLWSLIRSSLRKKSSPRVTVAVELSSGCP